GDGELSEPGEGEGGRAAGCAGPKDDARGAAGEVKHVGGFGGADACGAVELEGSAGQVNGSSDAVAQVGRGIVQLQRGTGADDKFCGGRERGAIDQQEAALVDEDVAGGGLGRIEGQCPAA